MITQEEANIIRERHLVYDQDDSHPLYVGNDWMLAWTDAKSAGRNDAVMVGPWPDYWRWSDRYDGTTGCCNAHLDNLTDQEIAQRLVNQFYHLVLGHGLDPAAVHREFWKIKCYREMTLDLCCGDGWVAFYQDKLSPHNP